MKCILFVEDEFSDYIVKALEDIGYLVLSYEDGISVYKDIKAGLRYDLALIDFSLRYFNWESIMRISKERNPKIPVISLSDYPIESTYSDTNITKPIELSRLINIINSHLQKAYK